MAKFKCKMCGGALSITEGQSVVKCDFCGVSQTLPVFDDEKKISLYNRANSLRLKCEFDKAAGIYETIVSEFSKEAEAYWGLILCKYGIEYVDDADGKKIPTCHRTLFKSIFEDDDYKNAIKYSDVIAKDIYKEEAEIISILQKNILEKSLREKPFDIFICYKETDENGKRTEDSIIAYDIFKKLEEKGYKVFFSRITLENVLGVEYEPYIFAALHSAKLMIHITTSRENSESVWVKNEWKRYLTLIKGGADKTIISCFKGISASELPSELNNIQGLDLNNLGAIQDLLHGIDKIFTCKIVNYPDFDNVINDADVDVLSDKYNQYVDDLRDIDNFCFYAKDLLPVINFFEEIGNYKRAKYYLQMAKLEYCKRVNSYSDCLQALLYLYEIDETTETKSLREDCQKKLIEYRTIELQNKGIAPLYFDELNAYCLYEVIESLVRTTKDGRKHDEIDIKIIESCKVQAISFIEKNFLQIIECENKKEQLIKIKNMFLDLDNSTIPSFDKFVNYNENKIARIVEQERIIAHKKKVKKFSVFSAIIVAILIAAMIITVITVNKNNGYKAENFTISVISKTNDTYNEDLADGYRGSGYYYTFVFTIDNASPYSVIEIQGNMDINNKSGKTLSSSTITMNGKLETGETKNWDVQLNVYKGDNAREIWNTDFSALEVTFKITSISFEGGTRKKYADTKNQIVHSCSDIPQDSKEINQENPSDEDEEVEKTLLEQITDYITENVVLPDNYLDYYVASE